MAKIGKIGLNKLDYVSIIVLTLFFCIINMTITAYAEESTAGDYTVSYRYLPQYNSTVNSEYTNLGYYSVNDLAYDGTYSNKYTYTIQANGTAGPVDIYSIVDLYDDFTFSLRAEIEQHSYVRLFKLINMNVYYNYKPNQILSEGKIKGSIVSYIPDINFQADYTSVYLQGKSRVNGQWILLQAYQVHSNETFFFEWDGTNPSNPSFNFSEYRLNFSLWNWNFDGLTLASRENAVDTIKICNASFSGVETNDIDKKLDELIDLQNQTITSIKGIGDLIKDIPDMLLDGIYDLFVPSDLGGTFSDYIDELLDKLGILGFPFQVIKYELEEITDYDPDSKIPIPDINVMGQSFLQDYTFDMDSVGQINVDIINIKLITVVRMITAYLFAMALIVRVKVLLYDFGILKSPDDDIGGDV